MAALVQGNEDRQLPNQVRCKLHERLALAQRLPDQPELGAVHVLDRLLQIADAAVHELGAAATGTAAEVSPLHQRHPQPARRGVQRAAASGGASTDDEHVEGLIGQAAQVLAPVHAYRNNAPHPGGGATAGAAP